MISEAAKTASYNIIRNHPVESSLTKSVLEYHVQSAIDAEIANAVKRATDPIISFHLGQIEEFRAEIATLKKQIDVEADAALERAAKECERMKRAMMDNDDAVLSDLSTAQKCADRIRSPKRGSAK